MYNKSLNHLLYERPLDYSGSMAQMYADRHKNDLGKFIAPRNITFQVCDECNLSCTYCYQHNKGKRYMSFETAKKLVDLLLSGNKGFREYLDSDYSEGLILDFIGGEPMLAVDLIDKTIDYFQAQTIKLNHPFKGKWCASISSNGTIYDDKVRTFLNKHRSHLSYSVSIDGNKRLHDACRVFPDGSPTYDIAMRAVNDRLAHGYPIGSKITIAHENLPYLFEAITAMYDQGHRALNANTVFEDVWEENDSTIYYEQLKKLADHFLENRMYTTTDCTLFCNNYFMPMRKEDNSNFCGGTGLMLACDPDGNLYPCLRYMESSVGNNVPAFRIGNLDDGIGSTDEYKQKIKCMKCITRRSQSTDECFYCPIAAGCAWCSALNYECNGTADKRVTYNCKMHKARALANVYYWNKLYKQEGIEDHFECWIPKEWALKIISEDEYNILLSISNSAPMSVEEAFSKSHAMAEEGVS